jgi:hypothetical protein
MQSGFRICDSLLLFLFGTIKRFDLGAQRFFFRSALLGCRLGLTNQGRQLSQPLFVLLGAQLGFDTGAKMRFFLGLEPAFSLDQVVALCLFLGSQFFDSGV